MIRLIRFILAALLFLGPANAQVGQIPGWPPAVNPTSYTGPGDIVSGATVWYGLRAYSAAVAATGTQQAVDLRRPADNATCTPLIGTNGSIDLTVGTPCNSSTQTVTSWVGSAATCTGAIGPASTTITVTSCSVGSLTVGALITGSGVSANTYVTAVVGGCTAVSSCTVSVSQTAASTTLTAAPSVPFVTKWYDQSGNLRDASQGTAANQPQLVLSGFGTNSRASLLFSNSFFTTSFAIADTFMLGKVLAYTALPAGDNNVDTIRSTLGTTWSIYCETLGANTSFAVVLSAGPTQKTLTGATSLSTSTLYSINVGLGGSNMRLYTNGTEDANSPVAASGALRASGASTTIGYGAPGRALAANAGELYVLPTQTGTVAAALAAQQRTWYGF